MIFIFHSNFKSEINKLKNMNKIEEGTETNRSMSLYNFKHDYYNSQEIFEQFSELEYQSDANTLFHPLNFEKTFKYFIR